MQRYFSKELKGNKFILNSDDIYHITKVMRMKENDKIEVIYNSKLYICKINNDVEAVIDHEEEVNNKLLNVTLIVPLLKEQKMDTIVLNHFQMDMSQ